MFLTRNLVDVSFSQHPGPAIIQNDGHDILSCFTNIRLCHSAQIKTFQTNVIPEPNAIYDAGLTVLREHKNKLNELFADNQKLLFQLQKDKKACSLTSLSFSTYLRQIIEDCLLSIIPARTVTLNLNRGHLRVSIQTRKLFFQICQLSDKFRMHQPTPADLAKYHHLSKLYRRYLQRDRRYTLSQLNDFEILQPNDLYHIFRRNTCINFQTTFTLL